jgi:hypothetical protein
MSSRFRQQFSRTGAVSTVRQFGEPATYYPQGIGTGRAIQVIVERDVEVVSGIGDQVGYAMVCRALDHATLGILSTEIDDGRDEISLPTVEGGTADRRSVTRKISTANGFVRFMVR